MTKTMTVAGLNELEEGKRTAFARGIHARKAKSGEVTIYLRRKHDGKTVDTRITTLAEVTRKSVDAAIAAAEAKRAIKPVPVRAAKAAPDVAAPDKLTTRSTMQEVWEHRLAGIEKTKFWSETNILLNRRRIGAHCAKWKCWTKPLADITADDILTPLLALRDSSPATGKKIKDLVAGIFKHGKAKKVISADPIADVKEQYFHDYKPPRKQRFAAIVEWEPLRELVTAIKVANGDASVKHAMLLQAATVQRTGEIIGARWSEFKLDAKVPTWTIPRSRMKIKDREDDQVLPLAPAVVAWLRTLPRHKSGFVFVNRSGDGHISSEAVSKAMRVGLGMGADEEAGTDKRHVPHGWRSSMATLARGATREDGSPLFAESWIEGLLDHLTGNQVTDAYLRQRDREGGGRVLAWWAGQIGF